MVEIKGVETSQEENSRLEIIYYHRSKCQGAVEHTLMLA
jgi:hypothetical protein